MLRLAIEKDTRHETFAVIDWCNDKCYFVEVLHVEAEKDNLHVKCGLAIDNFASLGLVAIYSLGTW